MDILSMNVEEITKQYLKFIDDTKSLNMDIAADYLVMAAELIHLKSRLLINQDSEEESDEYEINSEEDLKNKLLEYERIKNITDTFKELEDKRSNYYTKLPTDLHEYVDGEVKLSSDTTIDDLLSAFEKFLEREKLNKPLNTKITKRELSVTEREKEIRTILKTRKKCEFTELFESVEKPYVVVTFLSILEMSKNKELNISQNKTFGKIYLEMR